MDALSATLGIAAGTAAGTLAGLVPGLHPNTLIPFAAALPWGPEGALAITAAAFAHGLSSLLPATYLGVPDPDSPLTLLPAHRLLVGGNAREAVRVGVWASLAAILAVAALVLPYKWLVEEPGLLRKVVTPVVPWICLGVAAFLVLSERHRGWTAVAWAACLWLLSGALSIASAGVPLAAMVRMPASHLAPMLSGLFGVAGLLASLQAGRALPPQAPPARPSPSARRSIRTGAGLGILAGLWTSAVPGMSAGIATSLARVGSSDQDARGVLATMVATGAAHAGFTVVLLWVASQARTGLAQGIRTLAPPGPWLQGPIPADLAWLLAAGLAASALAAMLVLAMDAPAARLAQRVPPRPPAVAAIAFLVAMALLMAGPWGLAILAAATLVGMIPHATGVRRIHLVGSLVVPMLAAGLAGP